MFFQEGRGQAFLRGVAVKGCTVARVRVHRSLSAGV